MRAVALLRHNSSIALWVILALVLFAAPSQLTEVNTILLAKYCCYAIVAVGIGLAWGRSGLLVLGQGLYFGLGAYMMAMHMQLQEAGEGNAPQFLQDLGESSDENLPAFWEPFHSGAATVVLIVLIPALLAAGLGFTVFKRRVRGAYFAILSQALLFAFVLYIRGNQEKTGGPTGLTSLQNFFGLDMTDWANMQMLYHIAVGVLLTSMAAMIWLYRSRWGELLVAVRDREERARFLGYDPANIKLAAYVISAVLAAIAGALFAPINGQVGTTDFDTDLSIFMLVGVAVGGRNTLFGPVIGAIVVWWARYKFSSDYPTQWTYILGAVFVVVVAFLPEGVAGIPDRARAAWQRWGRGQTREPDPGPERRSAVPAPEASS